DKSAVAQNLSSAGYITTSIEEAKETKRLGQAGAIFDRITLEDLTIFTRQLLTLQKSGVALLASLSTLEKQTEKKRFKDIIRDVGVSVEQGASLSSALAKHPKVFSELYVNMVKAGEASGTLEEMLSRLAEFEEKEITTQAKIKSATRYPTIVLIALFCAFLIMVNVVVPKFSGIYDTFHAQLPLPTRVLLWLSFVMRHYWYLILAAMAGVVFLFLRYIHTKSGRVQWDTFKLKVPIVGPLLMLMVMSRFARTLAVLLKSGLPVLNVLDMVSRTVGNAKVSLAVDALTVSVKEGKGLSAPMSTSGLFPPMVIQMVAIGEETGKIDELLMKVSEYYDQRSDYMMENLATMIEPIFVLCLGGMVLSMALAIFLPMWNLISIFKH
ncbi:MAG: type II secretion system F family protein, partial [Candidatus Omnitrophica bacterium]|nr:type II secretion system F family protein [Candidatus Omnitrophota bacterium]